MKLLITGVLAFGLLSPLATHAQKKQGAGIHFGAYDFYGPQTNDYLFSKKKQYSYRDDGSLKDTTEVNALLWRPMVKFSFWWSVNKNIDLNMGLGLGNLQYPTSDNDTGFVKSERDNIGTKKDKFYTALDFRFNYNFLAKEEYIVSPYISAGVSGTYRPEYFGVDIPLSVGINFNLSQKDNVFLNLESGYRVAATERNQNHLLHTVGVVYWFTPGYKAPKEMPIAELAPTPLIPDSDNDGLLDNEDDCPSIAGPAMFNGCPDSDGDGISDKDDTCPLVAGLAAFNGCPDTDGDSISDDVDKCPYVAGTTERDGCPKPDKDGDGFADDEDKCPELYSKTNGGCPEIKREIITEVEKAAKAVFFESGKSTIKKISFAGLDNVARILAADPSLYVDIEGHTDNVQPKTYTNMALSQERAQAVLNYLADKGIAESRMTAQGFGETQPVADNESVAGRAQNRRTVIKVRNYQR